MQEILVTWFQSLATWCALFELLAQAAIPVVTAPGKVSLLAAVNWSS